MVSSKVKVLSLLSIIIALIAFLYKKHTDDRLRQKLDHVLSGLLQAEKKATPTVPQIKIAIGFGGCLDYVLDALEFAKKFNLTAPDEPEHYDSVESKEQLSKLFAYFFRYGAAAERFVSNETLFKEVIKEAEGMARLRKALGGNAPLMARRLSLEGANVLLASRLSKELLKTLPDTIKVIGNPIDVDDIHVILEYDSGSQWENFTAPRANRLIIHSDNRNPHLETLEQFEKELEVFDPSLLVIGGLQMMDNFPFQEGERYTRLQKLQNLLAKTKSSTKIHFELASFTDKSLIQDIIETVVLYADSLGMNEQELPNLISQLTGDNVTLISDPYPRTAAVLDQMRTVYRYLMNTKEINGHRRLTRLHIHTLAYQAILTSKESQWKNTMSAAAKASLTANRYVCGSDNIDTMKVRLIMDDSFSSSKSEFGKRIMFTEDKPVSCWEEEDYKICVAPVLVCTAVLQTAGGGDNISSAALLYQI
ncbi:hypothetical protein CHS0354_023055 [Potamilus streckersoni]|uniref:ADP-dependent glucokinase n=1 Tax=Potamilus streckersoni TaxID=2493646 RepID=A0AAE0RW88_9BIVA|nr:hypothetical protein CHS0354_023055 [Potamilus streckersoni]